jgi:L-alanine-DL-glutamate epimerase-like enolase superfamily enzyme
MAKIKDIHVRAFEKPLDGSIRNPRYRWTVKRSLLVFVETDDGKIGHGECWVDGGHPESLIAFLRDDLRSVLVGEDADLVDRHFKRAIDMTSVTTRRSQTWVGMSAVDTALWDLKAQRAGLPLWRVLGGNDPTVEPYASAGLYKERQTPAEFGAEYTAYTKAGYRGVKIKVGGAALSVDIARVAALREAMGPKAKLMVDAVSAYDVPKALAFARAAAQYDIHWFEQPLPIDDFEGMARIQREGGIPVCGIENDFTLGNFRRLLERDAVHFVQFDPIISGGITYGRKIAALAEAFHKPVTLHHSNTVVSMLANMHLAASLANCESIERHVFHHPMFERAPPGTLDMKDGLMTAPERPGLGIDLRDLIG